MKRLIACILLLMMLPVGSAFAKEKDWTIRELYNLYQGQRWQGKYTSVRGETVVVDAPIIIPDVDSAPVLRVVDYPILDAALCDAYGMYPRSYLKDVPWARSDDGCTLAMRQYWEFEIPEQYGGEIQFR